MNTGIANMEYSLLIFITWIFLGLDCVEGIVDGSPARLGEFPYMAAIMRRGKFHCGGALISNRHVLTAASCVTNNTKSNHPILRKLRVKVGMINHANPTTGMKIRVDRVSVHPKYAFSFIPFNLVNDVAVLTLKKSVMVSEFVRPIALPESMEEYLQGTQFIFSGFGSTSIFTRPSVYLEKMFTSAVGRNQCQAKWSAMTLTPGHLCTVAGLCYGDSGGPLTIDGEVVVGIASAIAGNCYLDVPNVYTKVSHYVDFVKNEMNPYRTRPI